MAATLRVPASRITPTLRNTDLSAWDSLGHVNLMMALEETFGFYIEVEEFAGLTSVPGILDFMKARGIE